MNAFVQARNPLYKQFVRASTVAGDLVDRDLFGLDVLVNGERIAVQKKWKFVVKYQEAYWSWRLCEDKQRMTVGLFSISDITVSDEEVWLKLNYRNELECTVPESDIVAIVRVRKKARLEDEDVQEMLAQLGGEVVTGL